MFKKEFPMEEKYFEEMCLIADLGYLGLEKDYDCVSAILPIKKNRKSRNNPEPKLTEEQKKYNKSVSQKRIFVENAIAGLKRYQIIANRIRIKKRRYREQTLCFCATIWNFYLATA